MIPDKETNLIYLSDLLQDRCPNVFIDIISWFDKLNILWKTLPDTRDIWAVDFMPLQITKDRFVQFEYDPDYLKFKKYQHTRTNTENVCSRVGITSDKANIVLDGGNVVKCQTKAILTAKIFKDNPGYTEENLIEEIRVKLDVEQIIIIPQEPGDFIGHADGMIRFINQDSVLVNKYPQNKTYESFSISLELCLRNAGLRCYEIPYTAWQNHSASDATGCYINFLETGDYIFYPTFNHEEDAIADSVLKSAFKHRVLIKIDCCELAKLGGILNCATWNILA